MRALGAAALIAMSCLPAYGQPRSAETITSVLRSDKLQFRRASGRRVQEFTGNVRYNRGAVSARADWAISDEKSRRIRARGRIRAERRFPDGTGISVRGETGTYDHAAGRGEILAPAKNGRVAFSRLGIEDAVMGRGETESLSWDLDAATATLRGDVWYEDDRGRMSADEVLYDQKEGITTLSGRRPVLTTSESDWSAAVQADRVRVYEGEAGRRRIVASGSTHGWVRFKDRGKLVR